MDAEKALIDKLLTAPAVTAIVGTRLFFGQAPPNPGLPYVVLWRVGAPRVYSLSGPTGLAHARIQFDLWASTAKQARQVGNEIRAVLSGMREQVGDISLQCVLLLNELDAYEDAPELLRITQEYRVWYQE